MPKSVPKTDPWMFIAGGGTIALALLVGAANYAESRIRRTFRESEFVQISMKALNEYEPAVEVLGKPIRAAKFDMSDPFNVIDGLNAKFSMVVHGPTAKAAFYSWCSRQKFGDSWEIDRLDLQLMAGQRWTFYKKVGNSMTTDNGDSQDKSV